MKRIQLFEFEDFSWFPTMFRSTITKIIVVLHKIMGTDEVIVEILKEIRKKDHFKRIVDLGSGSGGSMPMVLKKYNEEYPDEKIELMLSDLHPNPAFVGQVNQAKNAYLSYRKESLDASNLKDVPEGIKSMVNSFHHMPPDVAKKILHSAQENKQSILIYEIAENKIPTLLWWLQLPIGLVIVALSAILFVPFVKPLSWKDLLFTWLIPVIPIFYAWDGQASMARTYSFDDIKEMLPKFVDDYQWTMDQGKKENGKKAGYYVLGMPK